MTKVSHFYRRYFFAHFLLSYLLQQNWPEYPGLHWQFPLTQVLPSGLQNTFEQGFSRNDRITHVRNRNDWVKLIC